MMPTITARTGTPLRQTSIDYMKAFLVIGMITAYSLQLLSRPEGIFRAFSTLINLITFAGFFFCFGYVFYLVYLTKSPDVARPKMAKTALKTLIGYYISAIGSSVALSQHFTGKPFLPSPASIIDILTLAVIPWYSEFLLSFFLITLFVWVGFGLVRRLLVHPRLMLGLGLACLLVSVVLPADPDLPNTLGLLIGMRTYSTFPVVQYLPVFLTGLYMAQQRLIWDPLVLLTGGLGTAAFVGYYVLNREIPSRFPPSFFYLVGSFGVLYGYFLLANWFEQKPLLIPSLLIIGQNALLYLILSNLILFALSNHLALEPLTAFCVGVAVILCIGLLISLISSPVSVRKHPAPVDV